MKSDPFHVSLCSSSSSTSTDHRNCLLLYKCRSPCPTTHRSIHPSIPWAIIVFRETGQDKTRQAEPNLRHANVIWWARETQKKNSTRHQMPFTQPQMVRVTPLVQWQPQNEKYSSSYGSCGGTFSALEYCWHFSTDQPISTGF